jgi:hypothetical protein
MEKSFVEKYAFAPIGELIETFYQIDPKYKNAALELQAEQGLNLPLIADDLFINFDDRRTAAGLKVLGELSRRMQVVFLTHHDHLEPLAKEVLGSDLNVVQL